VVDPSVPAIIRRIDVGAALPANGSYFAHPDRARLINGLLYVVVPFYDAKYHSGPSLLAVIDPGTEQVVAQLPFEGATGCSGLDVSPGLTTLAVACSGAWHSSERASSGSSAVIGIALAPSLHEVWRVNTGSDPRAFAFTVSYVDAAHVIAARLGELGPPVVNDAVQLVDVRNQTVTTLFESAGQPASIAIGPCAAGDSSAACFVADASRSQVVRLDMSGSGEHQLTKYAWTDPLGLEPRALSFFGPSPR
jgi:hypothetical protein